jgi:hypothetical protein
MQISVVQPIENIDNIPNKQKNKCFFCDSKVKLQPTYYNKEIISCCFLCHITNNFDKEYVYHVYLCNSELSQLDIIKKTWEFYKKNGYTPLSKNIDDQATIIRIPIYFFGQFTNKNEFPNYKLFFTNKVQDMLIEEEDDIFETAQNIKKYNVMDYIEHQQEYQIPKKEKMLIDSQMEIISKNNFSIMTEIENTLKKRYEFLNNC